MKGFFSDSVPLNARITVDYNKGSVDFDYKERTSWFVYSITSILASISVPFWLMGGFFGGLGFWFSVFGALFGSSGFLGVGLVFGNLFLVNLVCVGLMIPVSFYIGYNYDKYKLLFPRFAMHMNALFIRIKKMRIAGLDSDKFTINKFNNIYLGYEASGDFSDMLESVKIKDKIDLYSWLSSTIWYAEFKFSGVPKRGELCVEYI